ncbi:DUF695 domain-containing protein [Roseiconus lacunae]|uniref:DUF695 domain-containing protein n=1 Tax=Roseiconus lacunae TaxID=2605694 RepID=A0ABT7PEI0_9BACT|nr:DUF695 domain-containing protein [Roseiconus lacunae]MCD0462065.1 DUF695 domain-containing protein [Roseiconus lacunae]MDM4014905.1 DUF695 domain-containing protein [Roseiconus lacunae]
MPLNANDLDPNSHEWMLGQIKLEDGNLFVRLNRSAEQLAGTPELGIKLGFAIPFNRPPQGGVPNADENQAIAPLEDQIIETVLEQATGIHVLTLTAPNVKELVFYIAEGADIQSMHERLRASSKTHDVQCMAVRDANWESFREFLPPTDG